MSKSADAGRSRGGEAASTSGAAGGSANKTQRAAKGSKRPEHRLGAPRPLAAYVNASLSTVHQAAMLAAQIDDRRFPWRAELRADAERLAGKLRSESGATGDGLSEEAARLFRQAVAREGLGHLSTALIGFERYRDAKPLRRPTQPPVAWSAGSVRLLDYGAWTPEPGAPAMVAVPSLINRSRILDLTRARSLMRGLAARGVRPFLIDWGDPGPEERGFDLTDYVRKRVLPAFEAAAARAGGRAGLLGHCMGGALALAAARALGPERAPRLALLATPWRFEEGGLVERSGLKRADLARFIDASGAIFGGVPPDALNGLFFARDPLQALRKFPLYARVRRDSPQGRLFVAVEDWLNDGVRLASRAAREVLIDWMLDDALAKERWRVDGRPLRLREIAAPTLVVASEADTITLIDSARGVLYGLPNATLLKPRGGHVGMVVGRDAESGAWDPLAAWFKRSG
ncbi:MAG: alpha/beta fold hydrolase [Pseudomonadota bacterium]